MVWRLEKTGIQIYKLDIESVKVHKRRCVIRGVNICIIVIGHRTG